MTSLDRQQDELLLCTEEPFFLSTPSPSPIPAQNQNCFIENLHALQYYYYYQEDQERDEVFLSYLEREKSCGSCAGYFDQLKVLKDLFRARLKAVQYIINVCERLSLGATTALNAANYLDRFLSMNSSVKWEVWMVEILSIACLSLSCKFDEVSIPSMHDLQMEEYLEHKFRPSTIEEMELTVLKALDWRLSCVTPLSYVALLLSPTDKNACHVINTVSHLLLHSLTDVMVLKFSGLIIAISALRCANYELVTTFSHLIPPDAMADVDKCMEIMKVHFVRMDSERRKSGKERSPVSVIDAHFH